MHRQAVRRLPMDHFRSLQETKKMQEVKFTMPRNGRNYNELDKALCFAAGGFTKQEAVGGWFDPDLQETIIEPIFAYTVAVKDSDAEEAVLRIAKHHNKTAGETALYWVARNGVAIIFNH